MLTISLDEKGRFEKTLIEDGNRKDGFEPTFIAGVIYDGKDTDTERERIIEYYRRVIDKARSKCKDERFRGEFVFPEALHSSKDSEKNRIVVGAVKEVVSKTFTEFLSEGTLWKKNLHQNERKGCYYTYCYLKTDRGIQKMLGPGVNTLLKDNVASNLYINMATRIIERLSLHEHKLDSYTLNLEIATRKIPKDKIQPNLLKEYTDNSYDNVKNGYASGNSDIYKMSLVKEMIRENRIKDKISLTVKEAGVKDVKPEVCKSKAFIYLADSINGVLGFNPKSSDTDHFLKELDERIEQLGVPYFLYCYDEVDVWYQRALDAFERDDYYEVLSIGYDIKSRKDPAFQYYSKKYFENGFSDRIVSSKNINALEMAVVRLEKSLFSNELNQEKTRYIFRKLERLLIDIQENENINVDRVKYKLYESGIAIFDHIGDFDKAKGCFIRCKKCVYSVSLEEYTITKNRMSVILLDSLNAQKAISNSKEAVKMNRDLLELQKKYRPYYKEDVNKSVKMGKALSQLAQSYASARNPEAEECFMEALSYMETGSADHYITLSYLLHYYLDMGLKDKYYEKSKEYFGDQTEPGKKLDHIVRTGLVRDPIINIKYALYVLVREVYLFAPKGSNKKFVDKLAKIEDYIAAKEREVIKEDTAWRYQHLEGHPMEIIYKYIAMIMYKEGRVEEAGIISKTLMSCRDEGKIIKVAELFGFAEFYNATEDKKKRNRWTNDLALYLKENFKQFKDREFSHNGDERYRELSEIVTFMYH